MKPRIPKPTSGHLDRFFLRCPEVGLGISNPTSGHLDRSFFFRCPEVGLGICLFAIVRKMKSRIPKPTSGHHLDRSFFLVSRGRFRNLSFRDRADDETENS